MSMRADLFGNVDDPTGHKGHLLLSRTTDDSLLPMEDKDWFGKVFTLAHRLGFAIHFQVVAAFPHEMAAQIRPVDVQFF